MKRRILSIFCVLALCLGLLPTVALAGNPTTLTVGGTTITSSGYWTTNADGTLTADGASADNYNVYYDATGTLTLDNATINGTDTIGHVGAGIYAEGDLTIVLEGSSTVTGVQDPNDESQSIRVSGNLTIQGDGSLTAQGAETSSGSSYGIFVIGSFTQQGGSVTAIGGNINGNYTSTGLYVYGGTVTAQDGTLTATGGDISGSSYGISMSSSSSVTVGSATVTVTGGTGNYSYGLYVNPSSPSVSPSVTLSGSGSLTARSGSGTDTAVGIYLVNIWSSTGAVTVGNGSTLLTNSVIFRDSSFNENPLAPTGDGSWLIYGQSGQATPMQGDVTLPDDLTIPSGAEVTIPAGSTLTVPQGKTLTVNGTLNIANQSSLTGDGTLDGSGAFNLTNPDPVISGSDTLTYDGTDQFSKFTLTAPSGTVDVMGQAFNISDSPSLEGWNLDTQVIKNAGNYTVTANHTDGRTIQKQVTVNKATSSISINNTYNPGKTYDGTALANPTESELTLTGAGYNDVTFTWYEGTSPNGTKLDSAPTDTGTYYLVASISESNNTSGSSTTSGAITISPATISITSATVQDKTYDGGTDATVGTVTFTGLVNGESLTSGTDYNATAVFENANAGESKSATVTVTLNNGNYTFGSNSNTANTTATAAIQQAALTVTAPSETITVGDPIPDLNSLKVTVTGLVGNDTFSGVTLTYDGNPDNSQPGTWAIEPSGGEFAAGVNKDNYTVSYVNGTLTVEKRPVSGGGTTTPSGPSTGGSDGWTEIEDEVDETPSGSTVTVDMNGTTEVPAEVFEAVAGKDVTLELDMGGGVKWEINGQDIPTDLDFTDLDMGVSLNTSDIPVDVINMVTGEKSTVQLSLAHDGEFGFTMTLTAPVGTQNKGLWANLYHYDTTRKQMLFETAAQVDSSGNVALKFTHASEYAIVLDESSHELPFTDTAKGAWYQGAVEYVYRNSIMTGTSATSFEPNAPLSRAMVAQILYNLEGQPTVEGESTFADASGHWAVNAIAWAQQTGVVNGYEDNTFRPNRAASREELAQMLYNYAKVKGYDLTASGDLTAFPDGSKVSSWAEAAMAWANGNELINGHDDGTLQPGGDSTRAQAASILMSFDLNLAN